MPQGGMANYIIRSFLELGLVDIRGRHAQTQEGEKKVMLGHLIMNLCKAIKSLKVHPSRLYNRATLLAVKGIGQATAALIEMHLWAGQSGQAPPPASADEMARDQKPAKTSRRRNRGASKGRSGGNFDAEEKEEQAVEEDEERNEGVNEEGERREALGATRWSEDDGVG